MSAGKLDDIVRGEVAANAVVLGKKTTDVMYVGQNQKEIWDSKFEIGIRDWR